MKSIHHLSGSRGHSNYGWLDTHYTFSFANYYDPERVHFGMLRVLNDDLIGGGGGFDLHPHDNMEIVTIVLEGDLEHKDNMGHTMVIRPGEVQVMSAGTGILHSEYNKSPDHPVQLLQIWVFPGKKNITPRYDQKAFDPAARRNRWQVLVSPDAPGSLRLNQQTWFSRITLDESRTTGYTLHDERHGAYIFILDGQTEVEGFPLEKRDGLGLSDVPSFSLKALKKSEILVIEVPMQ
ncbi:MAG: pirin family protein [Bacteroidales bacterium]|nr:pirin family protein [Bacteroidales bacterium]